MYELGRVGHENDLLIYVFPVVEQEFCQFLLVVWALSQDILHPCSGATSEVLLVLMREYTVAVQ